MAKKKVKTTVTKVYKKTPSYMLPKNPVSRVITVILDQIPKVGLIKQHKFVTSLGAGITFNYKEPCDKQQSIGFDLELQPGNQYWTAVELREAAAEFVAMAEYLEEKEEKNVVQS